MDINRNNNPVIWFRDSENPAFANLPSVPFVNFLNAFCPPEVNMMFGESDTAEVTKTVINPFTITTLYLQPTDTATHTAGALASEITVTVYVNGVAKFSAISTNGANLITSTLGTPVSVVKGDVISAVPSAAPGTGKQVDVIVSGTW